MPPTPRAACSSPWAALAVAWLAALFPGCATSSSEQRAWSVQDEPSVDVGHDGVFSFTLDNDLLIGEDGAYTNGFGMSWTSADLRDPAEDGFYAGVAQLAEGLPHVLEGPTFASITFGQEIFTPDDIKVRKPDPDDQPYAGLLFIDFAVHARDGEDLHSYKLRLGLVGPDSGAEYVQTKVHDWTGSDEPKGWDNQLENEVVLNVYYDYRHRIPVSEPGSGGWQVDLTPTANVALGSFANVVGGSVLTRFGNTLPDTFGANSLRGGAESNAVLTGEPGDNSYAYGFFSLGGYAVARYLPLDGNNWRDSASVNSNPFVANATTGLIVGSGEWVASLTFAFLSDTFDEADGIGRFGSISISTYL